VANKSARSFTRSRVARARTLAVAGEVTEESPEAVRQAISALDKAAKKGVIHPNQAARKKSRLQKRLNAATAAG
jgi:small subunit ribosomal protein S20